MTTTFSHTEWSVTRAFVLHNAHQDDVHGMLRITPRCFVSGSKDGSLKQWTVDGQIEREIVNTQGKTYDHWITALASAGEGRWMSGTRDGRIELWDDQGDKLADLAQDCVQPMQNHVSKERNALRINCLTTWSEGPCDLTYFVGQPTRCSIHHFDSEGDRQIDSIQTSRNDWVFSVHVLALNRLLIVTGDRLEIWNRPENRWHKEATLIQPSQKALKQKQREFISGVTPLEEMTSLYAAAIFGGIVAGVDLTASKELFRIKEHTGRVWMIENIVPNVFASCSDDRTIKLWDLRHTQHSQMTSQRHIGRVSTLLRLDAQTLVAGTCPDQLRATRERAQLVFWDLRM